jgi:RHS repeat-associated protein
MTGSNFTYNTLGAGGDNIGQVKVISEVPVRYYYLKDHLGSIKVTVDANGNVVGYDDYYPYGMQMTGRSLIPSSSEDSRFKFTGKELDASDGLVYFGKRYYDPWKAGWDQVDPMQDKFAGWSSYNYTLDNPLRFLDSKGLNPSDFYDEEGDHKHVDDKDKNAYLVSKDKFDKVDDKNAESTKKDKGTTNLGSNDNLVALSNVIFNEARGENNATQIAIAFTVINRSGISGKSLESEVYKPGQFSGIQRLSDQTLDNVTSNNRADLVKSYNSAFDAIIMNLKGINPIGNNVTHFFSPSSNYEYPKWGDPDKEVHLPAPYNAGNFIYWKNITPYVRK